MNIAKWFNVSNNEFPHPMTDVLVKLQSGLYAVGFIEYPNRNTWYPSNVEATYDLCNVRFESEVISWVYIYEKEDEEDF
jgi:hypothetical protein